MREHPIPRDDAEAMTLLRGYLESRGDSGLLADFHVEEAGRGYGSMGNGRVLLVLAPNEPRLGQDRILIEIKPAFEDPATEWYHNPFPHHGRSMIEASRLYAPDWEERTGYTTYQGRQYWGRQIHTQNVKLKKMLGPDDEKDLAYAVGTQLGRAHQLSLQGGASSAELEAPLKRNYAAILKAGETMKDEIAAAHARYLKKMKKQGLEPADTEPEDE
jgi:hypothetical protein